MYNLFEVRIRNQVTVIKIIISNNDALASRATVDVVTGFRVG